jgi:lipopolysaccharide transport system permease protein
VWACRHFWWHLARAEVRGRFRRSRLGILWALLQPLLLTLLMTLVFGRVFGLPMRHFAPFVFSGLLVWEFVFGASLLGCASFINAAPYIMQRPLPLAIYPLKTALATFVTFTVGGVGLLAWVLVAGPAPLGWPLLSLLATLPLLLALAWPLALITAFVNARYRDFQFMAGLLLQALWYVSPVFLEPSLFQRANLEWLLDYNPAAHVLNLVRAPLLSNSVPTATDYLFAVALGAALWLAAALTVRARERELVFYL